MWISEPTPVISSTKLIDSGSSSTPRLAWNPLTGIQENMCRSWLRAAPDLPSRAKNAITPYTKDPSDISTPSRCPHRSGNRPPSSSTAAPKAGNASSSHEARNTPVAAIVVIESIPSVLEQARVVDRRGLAGPVDGHQDGEPDHDLGRGHDHHEEGHHLPVQVPVHPREGDEGQVAGVEHQLDGHEDQDRVPPDQHADGADDEQDDGEEHEVRGAHSSSPPRAPASSTRSVSMRPSTAMSVVTLPSESRPS